MTDPSDFRLADGLTDARVARPVVRALPMRANGVDLRWLVLLHEAAHTQLGETAVVFNDPDWDPASNQAMSDLLTDSGQLASQSFAVFDETFADVYGGLMLARLTPHGPAAAAAAIDAMRAFRRAEHRHRFPVTVDGLFDAHAQLDTFAILSDDLTRRDYRAWVRAATPEQLRNEALAQASVLVVAWWRAHPAQFHGDFDWARADAYSAAVFAVTDRQRLMRWRQDIALAEAGGQQLPAVERARCFFGAAAIDGATHLGGGGLDGVGSDRTGFGAQPGVGAPRCGGVGGRRIARCAGRPCDRSRSGVGGAALQSRGASGCRHHHATGSVVSTDLDVRRWRAATRPGRPQTPPRARPRANNRSAAGGRCRGRWQPIGTTMR